MILTDGLIQFRLQLERYLVYEKEHKVRHCHQLRLQLVHLLLSMAGSKPQDEKPLLFSVFAGISSAVTCKKVYWTNVRIVHPVGLYCAQWMILH